MGSVPVLTSLTLNFPREKCRERDIQGAVRVGFRWIWPTWGMSWKVFLGGDMFWASSVAEVQIAGGWEGRAGVGKAQN